MSLMILHLILSVILGVLVGLPDRAAASAFSGTWVLDPTQGVLSDSRPRDVSLFLVDDGRTGGFASLVHAKRVSFLPGMRSVTVTRLSPWLTPLR